MKRFIYTARVLVVIVPLMALLPLVRVAADWAELSRVLPDAVLPAAPKGFDWVLWQDEEGLIVASYVFPGGPADNAGIRQGDVFYSLEYQQYFNAEDVKRAIEGIPPGASRSFQLMRDGRFTEVPVTLTRYPTFIYPLSTTIWQFSLWAFTLGAFLHILGLIIAGPLAGRSVKARYSLLLISMSALWVVGNFLRMFAVEIIGPPLHSGGTYDRVFQGLTLAGIVGWVGFPSLLLQHVLADAVGGRPRMIGPLRHIVHVPAAVLVSGVLVIATVGGIGPLTLDALAGPVLFYACCYIAFAAVLVLTLQLSDPARARMVLGDWGRVGSVLTFFVALFFGLAMLGVVPLFGATTDIAAAWLIVGAQLLSVVPVVLVSIATLKHGKIDEVVSRALTYITVFGLFFFALVGGLAVIDLLGIDLRITQHVVSGLYAVVLLFLFDRAARQIRVYASNFFASDRHRIHKQLSHFQEQMRMIPSLDVLLTRTVTMVGETLDIRSAVLFLSPDDGSSNWLSATYHPEPPYLTERVMTMLWPHLRREGSIWARNPELDESDLPHTLSATLVERGAALAVPIAGDRQPVGILVLGQRRQRRMVYNLEDVEMLRSLCANLAIAVERLRLVEREKSLVRESAEAQLVALRAQINPHFLFNALNTIAALIGEKPDEAEATLEHLAAIFRYTLNTGSRDFVALEEEFGLVQHYLAIEQVRFGDKLHVEMDLPPILQDIPVPAFAVQTLVENSVKHGLSARRGGGLLTISARQNGERVAIAVEDTGIGIPALFDLTEGSQRPANFYGIGLRNIAGRLEKLYGEPDLLHIESDRMTGTRAILYLPVASNWRTQTQARFSKA